MVALKDVPITNGDVGFGDNNNYDTSSAKEKIDLWAEETFLNNELKEINGYQARLITKEEYNAISTTHSWRYNTTYRYYTMSGDGIYIRMVDKNGTFNLNQAPFPLAKLRPVINVYKSALETNNNNE